MKSLRLLLLLLLFNCSVSSDKKMMEVESDTLLIDSSEEDFDWYLDLNSYLTDVQVDSTQIQVIDTDCAVFIYPSETQIIKMREENTEEDYATISDDFNFYHGLAVEKIDSLKVKAVSASRQYLIFKGNQKSWTLDIRKEDLPRWNIIFFRKDAEPKIVNAIEVTTQEIDTFFKATRE